VSVERLGSHRLALARQPDLLDTVLGGLEQPLAVRLEGLAALVDADGLVERHLAPFEIVDDLLQRLQRRFEAHRLDVFVGIVRHFYPLISLLTCAATENASPSRS